MNIKTLKELIANLPDETLVVTPDNDHGYNVAVAGTARAEILRHRTTKRVLRLWEYFGEEHRSYPDPLTSVEGVFVVGE